MGPCVDRQPTSAVFLFEDRDVELFGVVPLGMPSVQVPVGVALELPFIQMSVEMLLFQARFFLVEIQLPAGAVHLEVLLIQMPVEVPVEVPLIQMPAEVALIQMLVEVPLIQMPAEVLLIQLPAEGPVELPCIQLRRWILHRGACCGRPRCRRREGGSCGQTGAGAATPTTTQSIRPPQKPGRQSAPCRSRRRLRVP